MLPIEGGAGEANRKPDAASDFELVWTEFRRCPGFSPNMSKAEAAKAFAAIKKPPPLAELVQSIRGYGGFLTHENDERKRKRGAPHPMAHPARWLRQRRWEGFIETAMVASAAKPRTECDVSWATHRDRVAKAIGGARVFDAWLAATTLEEATERVTVRTRGAFQRSYICSHFAARLERTFGREVEVLLNTEKAA